MTTFSTPRIKASGKYTLYTGPSVEDKVLLCKNTNLITNTGLDQLATSQYILDYCYLGEGNSVPAPGDTTLSSYKGATGNTYQGTITETNTYEDIISGTTAFLRITKFYSFAPGVIVGNIGEAAIGGTNNGSNVISKVQLVDENANPTIYTIKNTEYVYVEFTLELTMELVTTSGNVNLEDPNTGDITTYGWECYPGNASPYFIWLGMGAELVGDTGNKVSPKWFSAGSTPTRGGWTGRGNGYMSASAAPYINGSFTQNYTFTFEPTVGNPSIESITFCNGFGSYIIKFTPAIPKTDTERVIVTVAQSWGR